MYIPLAVHKNELVVINNMDAFSHYFCLAKRQKMTPLAAHVGLTPREEETDEEGKTFFEDGAMEIADEEDEL